jgi:hypothetical protein
MQQNSTTLRSVGGFSWPKFAVSAIYVVTVYDKFTIPPIP